MMAAQTPASAMAKPQPWAGPDEMARLINSLRSLQGVFIAGLIGKGLGRLKLVLIFALPVYTMTQGQGLAALDDL